MKITENIHTRLAPFGNRVHLFLHRYSNELVISMLVVLLVVVVWGNYQAQQQNRAQMDELKNQAIDINRQLTILEGQSGARNKENQEIIKELRKHTRYLECMITALGKEEVAENARQECQQQTGFFGVTSSNSQAPDAQNAPPDQNDSDVSAQDNDNQPPGQEDRLFPVLPHARFICDRSLQ